MDRRSALALLGFAAAVAAAALLGSLTAAGAAEEYAGLETPPWAPPAWLFGPVWSVLYVMIAASGWGLWRKESWGRTTILWAVQLALNALWSPLFFGLALRGVALAWIIALLVVLVWLIARAWRHGWPAWLLLPYAAWVAFATLLNASIWWLN